MISYSSINGGSIMRLMCEISQSMGENCYFVVDESTNKAIVIDPGENGKKLNKK